MKQLLLIFCYLAANTVFAQSTETIKSIYFATAKHALTPESEAVLEGIIAETAKYETFTLTIQGNTDDKGNNKYNKALSERRANATKDFFVNHNIAVTLIELTAFGEEKPVADNADEGGKQRNRRVDIFLRGSLKVAKKPIVRIEEPPKADIKPVIPPDDINELYRLLANEPQKFEIDPTKDAVLKGAQGTVLYYKANSLATSAKKVNVLLKEVFNYSDMLIENLSTMTDKNEALETNGMFFIDFTDEKGGKINQKQGKELAFALPTQKYDADMRLYNGVHRSQNANNPHADSMQIGTAMQWNGATDFIGQGSFMGWNGCGGARGGRQSSNCRGWRKANTNTSFKKWLEGLNYGRARLNNDIDVLRAKNHNLSVDLCNIEKEQEDAFRKQDKIKASIAAIKAKKVKQKTAKDSLRIQSLQAEITDIATIRAKFTQKIMRLNAEMDKNLALAGEKYYLLDSLYNGNFISKNKLRKPFVPTPTPRNLNDFMQCTDIADMARRLGIPNILAFATALNPKFDAKNEADVLALRETLSTQFQAKIAQNTASTTLNDVQYYLGTTNVRNNWYNCDALRQMAPELLATVRVNIQRDAQTDCKIILKNRKMALYSDSGRSQYVIPLVVKNEPAYIVAMRYTNKQAYIAIQPFTATGSAPTENINFEAVSITELRDKLLFLNSL